MISLADLELPEHQFDFSQPVEGKDLDKTLVKRKIALWHNVLDNRLLTHTNVALRVKAFLLLEDPTIRAYAQFKFDGKPLEARSYQDALLCDKGKRILFIASNQLGKSLSLDVDAALKFTTDHKKNWVGILVSKSRDQSEYQMMRIKQILQSSNISYREENTDDTKTGKKDSGRAISFTFYDKESKKPLYTNLLVCCPPSGSALGYPCDEMWLDEFDYWENIDHRWFMNRVAIPRTFETDGRISVFTNPNGQEGYAWTLWNAKDDDGNYMWHRYRFNYWDNPNATQEGFKKRSAGMTTFEIQSTLLAEFGESAGSFFSRREIEDSLDSALNDNSGYGRNPVFFLDVGAKHDQSFLIGGFKEENPNNPNLSLVKAFYVHKYPVGYPISRVVGAENHVNPDDGWDDYALKNPSVKEVLEQYSYETDWNKEPVQPVFGCDVTGNSGIVPLFESVGIRAIDVTFSGPNKWKLYQRYKYLMEQRLFKRAKDRDGNAIRNSDFSYQASKLQVKKSANKRYRTIHHENENDLDDTQDGAVGMIYICDNPDLFHYSSYLVAHSSAKDDKDLDDEYRKVTGELDDQYIPSWMKRSQVLQHRLRNRAIQRGM